MRVSGLRPVNPTDCFLKINNFNSYSSEMKFIDNNPYI